jgi:hypothetical protein
VAKKKGTKVFQRLMNVVFIVWALWFLLAMYMTVPSGELFELTLRDLKRHFFELFFTFFGWLPIMAVNYILNNKATVWNKEGCS